MKNLAAIIEDSIEFANREWPTDRDMRTLQFISWLAHSVDDPRLQLRLLQMADLDSKPADDTSTKAPG